MSNSLRAMHIAILIVFIAVASLFDGSALPIQTEPTADTPEHSNVVGTGQTRSETKERNSEPHKATGSTRPQETPDEFVPSEEISADKAVSFPSDI
jgi:hypothetical protein